MNPNPRTHLPLFLTFLALLCFASSDNLTFNFPTFSIRNLTLLGDSYLRNGSIGLTRESGVPSSSSGTAIYNNPICFLDPTTNLSASFSTRFTFSVTNANPGSNGDGLTFFISSQSQVLGGTGAYLGLFNSSVGDSMTTVAVEFDTRMDLAFGDPNANHVGFDVNGPASLNATMLDPMIDLKSGNLVTAWIDYFNDVKTMTLWIGYTNVKPDKPILSAKIDLSTRFKEFMYVGFSASTEGSTEIHTVISWSFEIFGFPSANTLSPPVSYGPSYAVPVFPSNSESTNHKRVGLGLSLCIATPVLFCVVFIMVLWFFVKARIADSRSRCFRPDILKGPRSFSYKELSIATRGFHSSRVIGNGAFGTVYRAIQPETGTPFAVKRSKHSHQGKSEFMAELSVIASLRHKNLVQLQGWCDEKGELLLVYEFMPNGSLDKILQHDDRPTAPTPPPFNWLQRCNVAIGIASVLSYLHQECEQQVIHRDIKTSNIMLDANYNPRLGDFGLARLTEHNKSPLSTLTAGTIGYLAPEYLQYGKATEKTDVFSFGVVLLEVCCGRRPIEKDSYNPERLVNLVDWVWALYRAERLIEAADPRLRGEFDVVEMRRMLLVGLSCANPDCEQRPTMRRVVQILNCEVEPVKVPRLKPCLTFSLSLPLSLDEIVSDEEEGDELKSTEV